MKFSLHIGFELNFDKMYFLRINRNYHDDDKQETSK